MSRTPPGVPAEMDVARQVTAFVGADHVAVELTAGPGHRGVLRGSSPELVALGDMAETVGEGPTLEVVRTGRPCDVDDLHAADERWPVLPATFRVPASVRGMLVLPLLEPGPPEGPDAVIGVMVLARVVPGTLAPHLAAVARRTADLLSVMVMSRALTGTGAPEPAGGTDDPHALDDLLDLRGDLVARAVGLLVHEEDLSPEEALQRLEAMAFGAGLTLQETAEQLLVP